MGMRGQYQYDNFNWQMLHMNLVCAQGLRKCMMFEDLMCGTVSLIRKKESFITKQMLRGKDTQSCLCQKTCIVISILWGDTTAN